MKIALLPLDSRPCNYDFPQKIASLRGVRISVPPKNIMDFFKTPSRHKAVRLWLQKEAEQSDILILSVEQLIFGGLVASRSNAKTQSDIENDFAFIEALKKKNPRLRIFAFTILMRTTVSTLDAESKRWWEKIAEYSKLVYEYKRSEPSDAKLKTQIDRIVTEIPAEVLDAFLAARKKNHRVNMRCIEFVSRNIFEKLLILQEDCSSSGLQIDEQKRMEAEIREKKLGGKVFLHNGTDEAATELVSTAVSNFAPATLAIEWLSDNISFTAKYEDRPFIENLYSHVHACGIHIRKNAKCRLFILPPKNVQGDWCSDVQKTDAYSAGEYDRMAEKIAAAIKDGKSCYLLDLAYANGGDVSFLKTAALKTELLSLCGYAAWNTASNSLGTILAQIIASKGRNSSENWRFTAERLLDDLLYQGLVRQELGALLAEKRDDPWCLENPADAHSMLAVLFGKQRMLHDVFGKSVPEFTAELPWPRIFEASFTVKQ